MSATAKHCPVALAEWARHICPPAGVDMVIPTEEQMRTALDHHEQLAVPTPPKLGLMAALAFILCAALGWAAAHGQERIADPGIRSRFDYRGGK